MQKQYFVFSLLDNFRGIKTMTVDFKKHVLPHLTAIGIFLVLAAMFTPPLFEGKKLKTHDYSVYQSVSKEKSDYEEKLGRVILWTNSMFGGMPTYVIATPKEKNIFNKIYHYLLLGGFIPFNYIFWYFLGFYILMLVFRLDPWLSIMGALAFGLSSYLFIILEAGHFTKAVALGFMAPVFGGVYLAYTRRKPWAGMMLLAFFLTLQILSNHVQIVYYTFIIALVYAIFEFVHSIREKHIVEFAKSTAILILGAFIAVAINSAFLISTNEYIPYSQRGPSELSTAKDDRSAGLDRSYATAWSYGIDETLTLLIPNVKGGSSANPLDENSETYRAIERIFGPQAAKDVTKNMPTYFGDQPFTSGPVYVGAFIIFLFVLALMLVKGRHKWWLLTATILAILLSWGKNFMWFTDLFFDFFPYYNKFRVVAMTLVIAEFTIPLLAILGVRELLRTKLPKEKLLNYFYIALGITGLITMIYIIAPSVGGYEGATKSEYRLAEDFASYIPAEQSQLRADFQNSLVSAIHADRLKMVRNDAGRSLFFIILGAAFVYLLITRKIKPHIAIAGMALVTVIDMSVINKRYLTEDNFVAARHFDRPFTPSNADNYILRDSDMHYRVLNLSENTFNDGKTSMFHKSVGGYSAAKIRRYQELYDSIMWKEFADFRSLINSGFQNGFDEKQVQELLDARANTPVLNMINTKYIIYHPDFPPMVNTKRYGNAWFVNQHEFVDNADQEINKMAFAGRVSSEGIPLLDLRNTAVISRAFEKYLDGFNHAADPNAKIELVKYAPDHLVYEFNSDKDQLALFSEIFYPHGWTAIIDGKEHPHFRANYVLRAMIIPAGKHTLEFKFKPKSYQTGVAISYASSIALLLLIFGRLFLEYRKAKLNNIERKD